MFTNDQTENRTVPFYFFKFNGSFGFVVQENQDNIK